MGHSIAESLKGIIAQELDSNLDIEQVDVDAPLFEGGIGLDSFAVVELIALVEARFGFEFGEDDLCATHFESINTLAKLVANKIEQTSEVA